MRSIREKRCVQVSVTRTASCLNSVSWKRRRISAASSLRRKLLPAYEASTRTSAASLRNPRRPETSKVCESCQVSSVDSKDPTVRVEEYAYNETRYRMLLQSDEARAEALMKQARQDVKGRWELYKQMAAMHYGDGNGEKH